VYGVLRPRLSHSYCHVRRASSILSTRVHPRRIKTAARSSSEHYFLAKQPQKQYSLLYLSSMV
jgi:hypothetical protein